MTATRLKTSDEGQSLVEFALILPLFLLFIFGIIDLGRGIYAYNTIQNAAREGTRVAIVDQNDDVVLEEVQEHAVGLGLDDSNVSLQFLQPDTMTTPCNTPSRSHARSRSSFRTRSPQPPPLSATSSVRST